jgi:hypothetical protein
MDSVALSLGEIWRYALEFTLLVLTLSAIGAALGSLLMLSLAGLVTEGFPRLHSYAVNVPVHLPRVSKVQ